MAFTLICALAPFSSAQAEFCEITSENEILQKIKESHPELRIKNSQLQVLEAGIDQASQVPNPQVNFTTNHGDRNGFGSSETTGSLQYVFEMGRKQSSRIGVAESQQKLGEIKLNNNSDHILIDATLKIARHSQVSTMLSLYKESLDVFKKMRSSLRKNKQLSPEQQVQEDIVDMEVSKHRIRISKLHSEFAYLNRLLQFYSGQDCKISIKDDGLNFPKPKSINVDAAKTPAFRELEWESKLTGQKLSLAKSDSYPDIKIGPSMQLERGMGQDVDRFGVSLTMELPILNRNQGGRALARKRQSLAEARVKFNRTENDIEIQALLETYKTAFETLNLVPRKAELLKKHHRIEKFFLRGLISISTMVDGHDELLNLMEERDKHELLALETFLKINQARNELDSALMVWGQK